MLGLTHPGPGSHSVSPPPYVVTTADSSMSHRARLARIDCCPATRCRTKLVRSAGRWHHRPADDASPGGHRADIRGHHRGDLPHLWPSGQWELRLLGCGALTFAEMRILPDCDVAEPCSSSCLPPASLETKPVFYLSHSSWFAGNNEYGQLADGTTNQHLTPSLVATAAPFKAIASGPSAQHTLLLQASTAPTSAAP